MGHGGGKFGVLEGVLAWKGEIAQHHPFGVIWGDTGAF